MRKPIVAGNWKMHKSIDEATELASTIKIDLAECRDADVVLCPPFTALKAVGDVVSGTHIGLGAQNMHWEQMGAFTGEISPGMLRAIYCHYVIVGHSERRTLFHETNETVNCKVKAALAASLHPIMCVGEQLAERESGETENVVTTQVKQGLLDVDKAELKNVIVAYEPMWAIGTGLSATPEQAQEVHQMIRSVLAEIADESLAQGVRIQYGGSVKPGNAKELFGQPDIDGGLIGGAALEARSFVEIVRAAL